MRAISARANRWKVLGGILAGLALAFVLWEFERFTYVLFIVSMPGPLVLIAGCFSLILLLCRDGVGGDPSEKEYVCSISVNNF